MDRERTITGVATLFIFLGAIGVGYFIRREVPIADSTAKVDASIPPEERNLGPVQEITCEGVNFTVCDLKAQALCGEGKWVPVAYPGENIAMGHWIHDGGCYTGQSMLVRCKQ